MPRYVAFLRGVMPTNCKMPALKSAFEGAGFSAVKTILGSGNVVFDADAGSGTALARRAEAAMEEHLGRSFFTLIRTQAQLQALIERDPFARKRLPPNAKVVTFLRSAPKRNIDLPKETHGARILGVIGTEAFATYTPTPKGPVFMSLIEKTFGKDVTTRTWETVAKCAVA